MPQMSLDGYAIDAERDRRDEVWWRGTMKVKITVDIPDGWELACDEMRSVKRGEYYLWSKIPTMWLSDDLSKQVYVIIRESWQWPEWCTAKEIWWSEQCWLRGSRGLYPCFTFEGLDFIPPPDKTKIYQNPNWKAGIIKWLRYKTLHGASHQWNR